MYINVQYQGMDPSPWLEQFIFTRVSKLDRYLGANASMDVSLKCDDQKYVVDLAVNCSGHNCAFCSNGDTLYEAFSYSFEKAARTLAKRNRLMRDKIHKKYFSNDQDLSYWAS